ncbi:MAG: right-handed parallel beta-helix repeat-containing protein [Planctomycetota bacterium]|jgi:hypothetical protein
MSHRKQVVLATFTVTCGLGMPAAMGQTTWYVDQSATGPTYDGTSWCSAYLELYEALAVASADDEIRVADGAYLPDTSGLTNPREATFQLISGVAIAGGYAGCGAPDPDARDIEGNETILTGDLGDDDDLIPPGPGGGTPGETCADAGPINEGQTTFDTVGATTDGPGDCSMDRDIWYVYTATRTRLLTVSLCGSRYDTYLAVYEGDACPPTTLLACNDDYCGWQSMATVPVVEGNDYLIRVGGWADQTGSGAIDIRYESNAENSYHVVTGSGTDATTLLDGFTITAGNADGSSPDNQAGGMYNANASPTVTNCTFSGNSARFAGGMLNTESNPTLTNCTFSGNATQDNGGGLRNFRSSPTVTNCTFSGNATQRNGGGMWNSQSNPTLTNCTFSGNSADYHGGGMYNWESEPTLTNCTFSGNSADRYAGGMYNLESNPTVTNSVFWGNVDDADAYSGGPFTGETAQIHTASGSPTVTYSCIQDDDPNDASVPFGGAANGNIDDDPLFVRDPDDGGDGWGDDPATGGIDEGANDDFGDLRLQPGSPAIDAADNTALPAGITADLDGYTRFLDDPDVDDTGVGPAPIVDMGPYEAQGCTDNTDCDDGNVCTDDTCDAGACLPSDNSAPCDDGDPCTTGDICSGGACVSSPPLDCDDQNVCTDDTCNAGACLYSDNSAPCDDGLFCTANDVCDGGVCVGSGDPCSGQGCDETNHCTTSGGGGNGNGSGGGGGSADEDGDGVLDGSDHCPGTAAEAKVDANGCSCDQLDGDGDEDGDEDGDGVDDCDDQCAETPEAEATNARGCSCSQVSCDDGETCTTDSCVAGDCVHTAVGCDDGDACTTDSCSEGECVNTAIDCNDGDACTVDSCADGECVNSAIDCDDGDACTADSCDAGECFNAAVECPPGESCDPISGNCAPDDADDDGVPDVEDECPGTPSDGEVDDGGCRSFSVTLPEGAPAIRGREGEEVVVTAPASPEGFRFDYWVGDVPEGREYDNPLTLILDSDKSLEPVYARVAGGGGSGGSGGPCGAGAGCTPGAPAAGLIFFGLLVLRFVGPGRSARARVGRSSNPRYVQRGNPGKMSK